MAKKIDYFIAQANLMPDVAKAFGKVLGPIGKMPNPKAGAVVPPTIPDLKVVINKLKQTARLQTKNEQVVKTSAGAETMSDDDLAENILAIYTDVLHNVKDDKQKIKEIIIKFSMGQAFIVGRKYNKEELVKEEKKQKKSAKKEKTKGAKK